MKQTAVEWLEEQIICQQNIYIDLGKKNKTLKKQVDAILTATTLLKMKCEQAKEMEKEQQGYSEEEVLEFLINCPTNTEKDTIEWFEQFKNK
jgi:hypothetical protein